MRRVLRVFEPGWNDPEATGVDSACQRQVNFTNYTRKIGERKVIHNLSMSIIILTQKNQS